VLRRMFVGVDFSVSSRSAARYAFEMAQAIGGTVTLLYVLEGPGIGPSKLDAAHALLRELSLQARCPPKCLIVPAGGELDATLAVDASQALPDGLEARHFSSEDLRLIVPSGHRLAESGYVNLNVLQDESLLWPMAESSVRRRASRLLRASGVTPKRELELGSFLALRAALVEGLGVAILPRRMVGLEIEDGHLSSVGQEANDITLGYHVVSAPMAMLPGAVR
jgi:DNA-binding transcriptional LysR family regulator